MSTRFTGRTALALPAHAGVIYGLKSQAPTSNAQVTFSGAPLIGREIRGAMFDGADDVALDAAVETMASGLKALFPGLT